MILVNKVQCVYRKVYLDYLQFTLTKYTDTVPYIKGLSRFLNQYHRTYLVLGGFSKTGTPYGGETSIVALAVALETLVERLQEVPLNVKPLHIKTQSDDMYNWGPRAIIMEGLTISSVVERIRVALDELSTIACQGILEETLLSRLLSPCRRDLYYYADWLLGVERDFK